MQEAEVRGVDLALERLQPVAVALDQADADLSRRHVEDLEARQRRRLRVLAHMDPDEAGALDRAIGLGLHLVLEVLAGGRARHVDAVAGDVVLPAVIDAAQPALLVAAEEQRGAAMRAAMIHHADATLAVAEGDQLLAEQHQAGGRAVAFEFGREQCWQPIVPHQPAHGGARADLREFRAFGRCRHPITVIRSSSSSDLPRAISTRVTLDRAGRKGVAGMVCPLQSAAFSCFLMAGIRPVGSTSLPCAIML